jgi:hypothetical protein
MDAAARRVVADNGLSIEVKRRIFAEARGHGTSHEVSVFAMRLAAAPMIL